MLLTSKYGTELSLEKTRVIFDGLIDESMDYNLKVDLKNIFTTVRLRQPFHLRDHFNNDSVGQNYSCFHSFIKIRKCGIHPNFKTCYTL